MSERRFYEISKKIEDCYVCEKNITWEDEDIVPVYVLLEKRRSN